MEERTIYITEYDMTRLRKLIAEAKQLDRRGNEYLDSLEAELSRAVLVAPTAIPANVVTMNSKVRLVDLETQEEMIYTLVFPNEADLAQGKISVLAPIGTAMLNRITKRLQTKPSSLSHNGVCLASKSHHGRTRWFHTRLYCTCRDRCAAACNA